MSANGGYWRSPPSPPGRAKVPATAHMRRGIREHAAGTRQCFDETDFHQVWPRCRQSRLVGDKVHRATLRDRVRRLCTALPNRKISVMIADQKVYEKNGGTYDLGSLRLDLTNVFIQALHDDQSGYSAANALGKFGALDKRAIRALVDAQRRKAPTVVGRLRIMAAACASLVVSGNLVG